VTVGVGTMLNRYFDLSPIQAARRLPEVYLLAETPRRLEQYLSGVDLGRLTFG
jgi:hypothetical protein